MKAKIGTPLVTAKRFFSSRPVKAVLPWKSKPTTFSFSPGKTAWRTRISLRTFSTRLSTDA
jgi:hypothetical protein